jgi:2'-5' RNA ligase
MRTFVAIELPEAIRTCVTSVTETLQNDLRTVQMDRHVRWIAPGNLHLTIRFLGETSPAQSDKAVAGLSAVVRHHPPLRLVVNKLGCFPNLRTPRIVWLGMEGDLEPLALLQTKVEAAVQQAGFEPDLRAFSPHLTIGRCKRGLSKSTIQGLGARMKRVSQEIEASSLAWRQALTFEARELVLMQSALRSEGAQYTAVERFPFD